MNYAKYTVSNTINLLNGDNIINTLRVTAQIWKTGIHFVIYHITIRWLTGLFTQQRRSKAQSRFPIWFTQINDFDGLQNVNRCCTGILIILGNRRVPRTILHEYNIYNILMQDRAHARRCIAGPPTSTGFVGSVQLVLTYRRHRCDGASTKFLKTAKAQAANVKSCSRQGVSHLFFCMPTLGVPPYGWRLVYSPQGACNKTRGHRGGDN